jgi:hypothetical protein
MKKFIKNITIFLIGLIVIFISNICINLFIISLTKVESKETEILIVGDSHPRRCINPELLNNSLNICQSAEPYLITFWKLKALIEKVKPEKIIIGFAPHNISNFNDLKFSHERWRSEMFERSYLIEEFKLVINLKIKLYQYYLFLLKQFCLFPRLNHIHYIGNHEQSNESDISNVNKTINKHYYFDNHEPGISEISINFLDSMIKLCKTHHITPILINTPVHNSYKEKIPNIIQNRYDVEILKWRNKGITIFNNNSEKYLDKYFYNSDHLNDSGATIFTKILKEKLQQ